MKDIESQIREEWFPKHVATLTQHGDLQVLKWAEPGTGIYSCRYVFDGDKMYISGDIGEAVFWLTWKAAVHSFDEVHVGYFASKLAAFSGDRKNYDGKKAAKRLREWRKDHRGRKFDKETFAEMIEAAENCSRKDEWAYEYVNGMYHDFISELDADYWEWIYDIGDVMPARIEAYLIGLKMASSQLKERSTVSA